MFVKSDVKNNETPSPAPLKVILRKNSTNKPRYGNVAVTYVTLLVTFKPNNKQANTINQVPHNETASFNETVFRSSSLGLYSSTYELKTNTIFMRN